MKILAEPIDALVNFTDKCKPMPQKFKFIDKTGKEHMIRVDKVVSIEETKIAGIKSFVYRCQSTIGNDEKVYELKYRVTDCRWELYKA